MATEREHDALLWDMAGDLLDLLNIEDQNPPSLTEQIADYMRLRLAEHDAETRRKVWAEFAGIIRGALAENRAEQ